MLGDFINYKLLLILFTISRKLNISLKNLFSKIIYIYCFQINLMKKVPLLGSNNFLRN